MEKAPFTEIMSATRTTKPEGVGTPTYKEYMLFRMAPASTFMSAHDASAQIKSKRRHNSAAGPQPNGATAPVSKKTLLKKQDVAS